VLVSDVEFGHPFAVQSRIHALENLGDIFLQCSLQPLTSLPVRLSDVQLRGSPYQFWSMNEFLLEHTLPAGHTFNLVGALLLIQAVSSNRYSGVVSSLNWDWLF